MSAPESSRTLVHVDLEPTYFFAGTTVKFVSTPDDSRSDLFLLEGNILPQALVPLHKHADPEIFHVLEGEIQFYVGSGKTPGWLTARAGDVINIPGDTKHAFHNKSGKPVRTIAASGKEIYAFFREIFVPFDPSIPPAPPTPEQMQALFEAAARHGYWVASPEENAAIGLELPPPVL